MEDGISKKKTRRDGRIYEKDGKFQSEMDFYHWVGSSICRGVGARRTRAK